MVVLGIGPKENTHFPLFIIMCSRFQCTVDQVIFQNGTTIC